MVDWIREHIKWVFSGVGVAIIVAIISLFFGRQHIKSVIQKQTSGGNSANVQVGGDVKAPVSVEHVERGKIEINEDMADSTEKTGKGTMVDWIAEHIKWVFSGVGVAIIAAIISLFLGQQHTKNLKQKQTSGDNSANIQVGGDVRAPVNVEHVEGDKIEIHEMTDSDVRRAVEETLKVQSKSVSIDSRLQAVAKKHGKTLQQLKDEISQWIRRVKTPYEEGLAALYQEKYQDAENFLKQSIGGLEHELSQRRFFLGLAYAKDW
ncbi:hypothetical protein ACFL6S_22905 [Candidatus Poribacteria bacterium]